MGRGGYASLAGAAPINSFGQDFLGGAAAGEKMRQVVGDIQINDRLKQIGDAVTQAGGNLDEIKTDLFSDPVGLQALGEYTKQYTESTTIFNKHGRITIKLSSMSLNIVRTI